MQNPLAKFSPPEESLHAAAAGGDIEKVKRLLDGGADVHGVDAGGMTPLHRACAFGGPMGNYWQALDSLNALSADEDSEQDGALRQYEAIARLLLERGAHPSAAIPPETFPGMEGFTPLHLACSFLPELKTSLIRLLLESGADPNAPSIYGDTPFALFHAHSRDLQDDGDGNSADLQKLEALFLSCGAVETEQMRERAVEQAREKARLDAVDPGGDLRPSRTDVDLASENLFGEVFDLVYLAVEKCDYDTSRVNMTPDQRRLYAAREWWGEVMSGNSHSYFSGNSGDLAPQATEGLRQIGANAYAEILERGIRIVSGSRPYPVDYGERESRLSGLMGWIRLIRLMTTDRALASLSGDLLEQIDQYIRDNSDKFLRD